MRLTPFGNWFEDSVIGSLYLLGVGFLTLYFADPAAASLAGLPDYAAYVVPLLISLSYLSGSAIVRCQAVIEGLAPEGVKDVLRGRRFEELAIPPEDKLHYVTLLQYGSEALIKDVAAGARTLRLFRSLIGAVPFTTTAAMLWLSVTEWVSLWPVPAILGSVATLALFLAHRQQYKDHYSTLVEVKRQFAGENCTSEAAPLQTPEECSGGL